VSHLLLHCLSVKDVWNHGNIDFNISADDVRAVVERWLDSRSCSSPKFEQGSMIMWWVWKNRYKWVFKRIQLSAEATRIMANSTF